MVAVNFFSAAQGGATIRYYEWFAGLTNPHQRELNGSWGLEFGHFLRRDSGGMILARRFNDGFRPPTHLVASATTEFSSHAAKVLFKRSRRDLTATDNPRVEGPGQVQPPLPRSDLGLALGEAHDHARHLTYWFRLTQQTAPIVVRATSVAIFSIRSISEPRLRIQRPT